MKQHTPNRMIALVLLALLAPGSALAYTGNIPKPVPGHPGSAGIHLEVEFRSGDWIGTAVVAFKRSPVELLSPAWIMAGGCSRSSGSMERIHRGVILVRALGRAAWAVLKQTTDPRDPGANGEVEEGSDADRRRPA